MRAEELYKPRGRPRLAGAVLALVPVFAWPGDGAQGSPALGDTETTHSHVFHSPPHPLGCPACQLQPLSIPTGQAPQQFSMPEGVPSVTILCSPAGPSREELQALEEALTTTHDRAAQHRLGGPKGPAGTGIPGSTTLPTQLATHGK